MPEKETSAAFSGASEGGRPDAVAVGDSQHGDHGPRPAHRDAASILRLTIEVPGFYVDATDTAEDVEAAMQLVTEQITVTFAHTEGDSNRVFVKPMEANIVGYEVRRV